MAQTVDEYLAKFNGETLDRLVTIRKTISREASDAVESFSYGMIGYKLHKKPLMYFGYFASHIGLYATPSTHDQFDTELSFYRRGKASVQFPLDQPLPLDLIKRIVQARAIELKGE